MMISFMLHWTSDIIHDAYLEAITAPLSRIRGKARSETSLCCCPQWKRTAYQLLDVSI